MKWLDIPDFPEYQAAEDGSIRSIPRLSRHGRRIPGVVLTQFTGANGYLDVFLYTDTGRVQRSVHRLVASAFHPKTGPMVRHRDGNRLNNAQSNLTWGTRAENYADRRLHGTGSSGERHGRAKLTTACVERIREAALFGASGTDLSHVHFVAASTVSRVIRRLRWGRVAA